MNPIVGRIVHFRQGDKCFASVITWVWSGTCVNLFVFPSGSIAPVPGATNDKGLATSVPFSDSVHAKDWSWHWPEKESE